MLRRENALASPKNRSSKLAEQEMHKGIFRVELKGLEESLITHSSLLSYDTLELACSTKLPLGQRVDIELSFPRFVRPIPLWGTVVRVSLADGLGKPASITMELGSEPTDDRKRFDDVVRSIELAPQQAISKQPYRVLLVEDSSLFRTIFAHTLSRCLSGEVELLQAKSGQEAIELVDAGPFDLVVVDYMLPDLGGNEFIDRLRSNPDTKMLPIVAVSAGGAEARVATLNAGADLFLDKPFAVKTLLDTVQALRAMRQEKVVV